MVGPRGIGGPGGEEITAARALSVGRAVASDGSDRVVVGRNARATGAVLADAVTAGLRECGADVLAVGVAPTPTIARTVSRTDATAGIVVTAAHDSTSDDGLMLRTASGKAVSPEQRAAIAARVERGEYDLHPRDGRGSTETVADASERHVTELVEAVSVADPPSVVVDVGDGAGEITARVLSALGCDVGTLHGRREEAVPGWPGEPVGEAFGALSSLVEATDARLGIAHDGDADRMLAVDETGAVVPRDVLLALFARATATDGDIVVVPVGTSMAVDDALATVGVTVRRTQVGDTFVADCTTWPDVAFGGDPSGAWIWPDETPSPDGPLAACKLVELVADRGPLSSLAAAIETYPSRRASVAVEEQTAVMNQVRECAHEWYDDVDTLGGVYVDVGAGWLFLRASDTEPVIHLTVEARDEFRAERLEADAIGLLETAIATVSGLRP
ncbi:phosphoglucosamine mutase [Natrinema sp. J7-2]|uniref:phosphoglucosamine mutase n=1 Tax=Natrinema sp. (strain J7-2) TaxID=406552 RepID=UPI00026D43B8|nr:phosphoglucosamine mutase [Natrinema sp. J7-2]AFO58944.1 phosphoglucomutase/phosphomannomutase alpha/beta/alpha domain I [Natrinema sp. J7-2]